MSRVAINHAAALAEAAALNDYYRNRALLLAQTNHELQIKIAALQDEINELQAKQNQILAENTETDNGN